ncbi:hypothetical protein Q8F55_002519 [Vanrija albida]|uniref:histidine kinase n=1 Tax=Vanrija albida TaxID=181172 RepID=A0ABR3QAM6_9TREE
MGTVPSPPLVRHPQPSPSDSTASVPTPPLADAAPNRPPGGAAFLHRLHTDPKVNHVNLPGPEEDKERRAPPPQPIKLPSVPPAPGWSSFTDPERYSTGSCGSTSMRPPYISSAPLSPLSRPPMTAPSAASVPTSPMAVPGRRVTSRGRPKTAPSQSASASMSGESRRISPGSPSPQDSDGLDGFQALASVAGPSRSNFNRERAGSFTSATHTRNDISGDTESERLRRINWEAFGNTYAAGRFDPVRIPNIPEPNDSLTSNPVTQQSSAPLSSAPSLPVSRPTSTDSLKQSSRPPYKSAPPSAATDGSSTSPASRNPSPLTDRPPVPGPVVPLGVPQPSQPLSMAAAMAGRQKAKELENLPTRRPDPEKLDFPAYSVAAATVRMASSTVGEAMFSPLSAPSPERELVDPLASFVGTPPIASTSDSPNGSMQGFPISRSLSHAASGSGSSLLNDMSQYEASPFPTPFNDGPSRLSFDLARGTKPRVQSRLGNGVVDSADDYFSSVPARRSTGVTPVHSDPGENLIPTVVHPSELGAFYYEYGFLPALEPPNEKERLKALYSYNIWHSPGDPNFDRIVHMAKLVFNTRLVLLNFIDSDTQWLKSQTAFARPERARNQTMSAHAILNNSPEPFVVLDTDADWRFVNNPHVLEVPHVRFYAGAPLRTPDGYNLGTLCILDDKPRKEFTPRSRHILKEFAAVVMREMELWRDKVGDIGATSANIKLQLATRDKIQTSMEKFTRECLEIDDKFVGANFEAASRMDLVYSRAAKLVRTTLELDGCTILDISQLERITISAGGDQKKVIYRANPYLAGNDSSVLEQAETFGPINAFPVLASTPSTPPTRPLTAFEHERLSEFLCNNREGKIFENVVPSWIRYMFSASLKYAMVVPVFGMDQQPFALICAYTLDKGKQFLEGYELQFLRAIGVIILSAVLRRRMVLADRSKSVLISSVSHELRTPLHGILAAAELLKDTPLDHDQQAYLATVATCGMQLIETVNHVLDFTKLSGTTKNGATTRQIKFTTVNLAEVIEQTVESCWMGQRARAMQVGDADLGSFYAPPPLSLLPYDQRLNISRHLSGVETVIDISLRAKGWNVVCESGGLRRILMNLYGNSLKFTREGYVQVILREGPHTPGAKRFPVELSVVDTGKGIGKDFLKDQLFHPFSQENPLQPGTGLGLSIVNSIVRSDAVNGDLEVWSAEGVGTQIRVTFDVELAEEVENGDHVNRIADLFGSGYKMAFSGYDPRHTGHQLNIEVLGNYAANRGFEIITDASLADIVFVNDSSGVTNDLKAFSREPGNDHHDTYTRTMPKPVGPTAFIAELDKAVKWLESHRDLKSVSGTMETLRLHSSGSENGLPTRRPTPPHREMSSDSTMSTDTVMNGVSHRRRSSSYIHRRRSDDSRDRASAERPSLAPRGMSYNGNSDSPTPEEEPPLSSSPSSPTSTLSTISLADGGAMLKAATIPADVVINRRTRAARVMVVEDNAINRRVLAAFLKKHGFEYAEAINGAAGVDLFEKTPPSHWDVVLMDITMPVMNGYEATQQIRRIESARRHAKPSRSPSHRTKIFALTGLATSDDKRQAFASGVDGYLVKPVSLASLDLIFKKIGF